MVEDNFLSVDKITCDQASFFFAEKKGRLIAGYGQNESGGAKQMQSVTYISVLRTAVTPLIKAFVLFGLVPSNN